MAATKTSSKIDQLRAQREANARAREESTAKQPAKPAKTKPAKKTGKSKR